VGGGWKSATLDGLARVAVVLEIDIEALVRR
jgi:hypothetical protein